MYWIPFQLSFKSYLPKKIEKGMLFLKMMNNEPYVFRLESLPENEEKFLVEMGYPIEPYIVDIGENPHVDIEKVIVDPDNIGWMDEGEFTDYLKEIDCNHFNRILSGYDGHLELEMEDDLEDEENLVPCIIDSKVIIRYPQDVDDTEEENDSSEEE